MSAKLANFLHQEEFERLQEQQYALDQFALTAVLHPAGLILSTNDKLLRVAGYRPDEVLRKPYSNFLVDDVRRFFIEHVLPLLNRGIPWRGELCHVARNQALFWTEASITPVMDEMRNVERLHFIGFDVTERKAVERALSNNSVFFSKLMEIAPIGFFLADAQGRCTYINSVWTTTSGCRLRRALGQGWMSAVHPDDREWLADAWQDFIEGAAPFHCEYRYQHPDGRTIWVMSDAERVDFAPDARTRYIRVEKDLTERKESERLIHEQRAKMVAASRMSALGEMAGGIAHEINNPLAILQLRARQIQQLMPPDGPHADRLLKATDNIRQTTERIAAIVRSLRAIAREGHGDPFELTLVRTLIEHTLEVCSARFQSQDIALTIVPFDRDLTIWCRSVEILQVLLNLLNNAYSAVEQLPKRWVTISVHEREDELDIWVTDSGSGIPRELHDKVFQPFFTTKPVGSGTGLGLSISKAVALDHHGDLSLDPDCAHTRFILRLPQYPPESP